MLKDHYGRLYGERYVYQTQKILRITHSRRKYGTPQCMEGKARMAKESLYRSMTIVPQAAVRRALRDIVAGAVSQQVTTRVWSLFRSQTWRAELAGSFKSLRGNSRMKSKHKQFEKSRIAVNDVFVAQESYEGSTRQLVFQDVWQPVYMRMVIRVADRLRDFAAGVKW